MRHIDPHSDMQEGIEDAPPPNRNPDGTVVIPPQRAELPPRPSLCQAGPCRHYHRFATQVDAANPRAVRLPIAPPYNHTREDSPLTPCPACAQLAGTPLYQAPAVFHVEMHHYCYPTPGVEMPLGALAITECSRWDPVQAEDHDGRALANRREAFQWTAEGVRWGKSLVDWEAARLAEAEAATEAERLLAGVLQDAAERRACQFCGRHFVPHELDASGACAGCAPQAQAEEQQRARRRTTACDHVFTDDSGNRVYLYCQRGCGTRDPHETRPREDEDYKRAVDQFHRDADASGEDVYAPEAFPRNQTSPPPSGTACPPPTDKDSTP